MAVAGSCSGRTSNPSTAHSTAPGAASSHGVAFTTAPNVPGP